MIVKVICRGPVVRGPKGYCEEGYTVTHDDGSVSVHAHPGYGENLDADTEAYVDIRAWLKAGGVLTEDLEIAAAVYNERKLAREMFFALPEAEKDDLRWEIEQLKKQRSEVIQPEPEPEPEPEHHFADLMLADETIDDARARLSQRLRELRHYLIAPEIKVNQDGSVGLTAGEQSELQDLERRQTLGRWLEA